LWETIPAIAVSPKRIVWDNAVGKELKTNVTLCHSNSRPFKLLKIKSTSPYVNAIASGKGSAVEHSIEVTMSAKAKAGMYQEKLTLKLDDPEQDELEITIVAILR
jgi:hypothetical protein